MASAPAVKVRDVPVTLPNGLSEEQLLAFRPFNVRGTRYLKYERLIRQDMLLIGE
jgi:hypothetical protein